MISRSKLLKGQVQGFKASITSIYYSKSGNLITNPADVTKRWVEYVNDLLNGNTVFSPNLPIHFTASGDGAGGMAVYHTYQEVTLAIKRLKNKKSSASYDIPVVLQEVWSEEELPSEWIIKPNLLER